MRKKKKNLIKALVVAVIVGLAGFGGYEYKQNSNHTEELAAKEAELEANSQTVYVATADIAKGEKITAENVEMQPVYTGLDAYFYITADDIGSTAIVDIEAGVPVMYSMITDEEIANDTRDYEIAAVNLVTTQALYDVIDVRITFPDGSDYIVLSQKTIKDINLENCVFSTNLNEEEILRFTCAMVDAYTTTGTRLYTTRYVESNIQETATPTYPVSEVTKQLIAEDPNVVTVASETLNTSARLELESRLGLLTTEQLDAVNEGFGLTDTAKSSVLQSQQDMSAAEPTDETTMDTTGDDSTTNDDSSDAAADESSTTDVDASISSDDVTDVIKN